MIFQLLALAPRNRGKGEREKGKRAQDHSKIYLGKICLPVPKEASFYYHFLPSAICHLPSAFLGKYQ